MVQTIALKEKEIYVVTGAIFPSAAEAKYLPSGKNTIPQAFYKVIYDLTPPVKMISFIIPHRSSNQPLQVFAVSVDEVEKQTGLDFFTKLEDDLEERLEIETNHSANLHMPYFSFYNNKINLIARVLYIKKNIKILCVKPRTFRFHY